MGASQAVSQVIAMATPRHTILLVQYSSNPSTRSYQDYDTVTAAMDGVCKMYEKKLQQLNPTVKQISYDIADLFRYLDSVNDICALVFDPATNQYSPHNKEWVKDRVFNVLK